MRNRITTILWIVVLLLIIPSGIHAQGEPEPSIRYIEVVSNVLETEWWMLEWSDNALRCLISVEHAGIPNHNEIYDSCGETNYQYWVDTPACDFPKGEQYKCEGVYLHEIVTREVEKTSIVKLPDPTSSYQLERCDIEETNNLCTILPSLLLSAEEPLPNEQIVEISGTFGEQPFKCDSSECTLPMDITPFEGLILKFVAKSSFGDSTREKTAIVRVLDAGPTSTGEFGGYYVDLIELSEQGLEATTCPNIWGRLQPIGELPEWLSSPISDAGLATSEPLALLAGKLLSNNIAGPVQCDNNGVMANGYASTCGLDAVRPDVNLWQNQFDSKIIEVAYKIGMPSKLLKRVFSQESQMWIGEFPSIREFGIGQITNAGADTLFLWNPSFFAAFCPTIFTESHCESGYYKLPTKDKEILKGALIRETSADCTDCLEGYDIDLANYSIDIFSETILANCQQVRQVLENADIDLLAIKEKGFWSTDLFDPSLISYEDLWRFTLANYNGGPGCLIDAVKRASVGGRVPDWTNVSQYLKRNCPSTVEYVDKITGP